MDKMLLKCEILPLYEAVSGRVWIRVVAMTEFVTDADDVHRRPWKCL